MIGAQTRNVASAAVPAVFFLCNQRGELISWNADLAHLSGYSPDELSRMRLPDFFAAESKAVVQRKVALVFGTGEANFEAEFLDHGGHSLTHSFTCRRMVLNDIVFMMAAGVATGENERRRAESEVRRLDAELEKRVAERTAQLEAANRELEAFTYSVSHDLRAPLRAVNGFAEIVLAGFAANLPDEGRRLLERIRCRSLRMSKLVDDLLEFSRLSQKPLERRDTDMRSLVHRVLDGLTPLRDGREVVINVGNLPPSCCEAALVQHVWVNLLSNAIKYTQGREPAVIDIGWVREGGEPVYFVRDNGTGFDMQFAHKLFAVFERLHTDDQFEGTGVGLSIVRRIVERHRGRVWATAAPGQGATFRFTLQPADTSS